MTCFECGRPAAYRHHVIPKSRGGKKTVALCGACHALVHGRRTAYAPELIRDALRSRRAAGMKTGGDIPFGYRGEAGRLVPDAEEQKAVRLVLDLHGKGESLRDIGRALEAAGIARKGGSRTWHPQAVQRIIKREQKAA